MKIKFFLAAILAMAIVSCNKDNGAPEASVDGETAFVKVNLKQAGSTFKATPGSFEYGLSEENQVTSVNLYFFDEFGAAYYVNDDNTENCLVVTEAEFTANTGEATNIESVSDIVLVIKKAKKTPPCQVVAIVNAPDTLSKDMSIEFLETVLSGDLYTENGFVMSNSVYLDGGVKVIATPITAENIFTTADPAFDSVEPGDVIPEIDGLEITPIDIYVERVAAKVRVAFANGVDSDLIPVYDENGKQMVDADGNAVYTKVLGWDVTNNTDEAQLIKSVFPSWTDNDLGFAWNDADNFRSYWAYTSDVPQHNHTFDALMERADVSYDYYYENTAPAADENSVDVDENGGFDDVVDGNQTPQLLVAAQLVDAQGEPIYLAKWYNVLYTIADAKTTMVNTVASKLYVLDTENSTDTETHYKSVTADDVTFYQAAETTAEKRYEVFVTAKEGVNYFNRAGEALSAEEAAKILAAIEPAQMWEEGYTYYYMNIKHFGEKTGIVRNHCYEFTIDGVKGFGTPVYDPSHVITPEKPKEQEALNLSAQINILSWSLVQQNVTLQ